MVTKAIMASLEVKKGMQQDVEDFLRSAKPIVESEPGTVTWYAVRLDDTHYAIFDTFHDETGRDIHLHGKIAEALRLEAPRLFTSAPIINSYDVIADKTS